MIARADPAAEPLGSLVPRLRIHHIEIHERIIDAAVGLFRRKGFDATTIDEIAEAVELSPRTFFRYFESKEDVALGLLDQQFATLYAAFAARPAHEPVLTALRHALVGTVRAGEGGTGGFDADRFSCMQQMMRDSPEVPPA